MLLKNPHLCYTLLGGPSYTKLPILWEGGGVTYVQGGGVV
jgi:hypothetical protein